MNTDIIEMLLPATALNSGVVWASHARTSTSRRNQVEALVALVESLPDFDESDPHDQRLAHSVMQALAPLQDFGAVCLECALPADQMLVTRNILAFLDGALDQWAQIDDGDSRAS